MRGSAIGTGYDALANCSQWSNVFRNLALDSPSVLYNPDIYVNRGGDVVPSDGAQDVDGYKRIADLLKGQRDSYALPPLIMGGLCFAQIPQNSYWAALWNEQQKGPIFPREHPNLNPMHSKLDQFMYDTWLEAHHLFPELVSNPESECWKDECSLSDRTRTFANKKILHWHDDQRSVDKFGQNLVVMLAMSTGGDKRCGTLLMEEKSKLVYQNAGWNGIEAFTLTMFPSSSTQFDHAAPLGEGDTARRSLTWRLPTNIGHTLENDSAYQELMQHMHDRITTFPDTTPI